jgi:SAM-dependent methyltransferase
MTDKNLTIIIPTYNNKQQLTECLSSLLFYVPAGMADIVVINNGHKGSCDFLIGVEGIEVYNSKENLGWTGGIKKGMEFVKTPYVMFMNDDAYVPTSSSSFLQYLIAHFIDPQVGAVGPSTNMAMGTQNIWHTTGLPVYESNLLIFFCVVLRTEAVIRAGGIDDSMSGGDDFDLCIRLQDAGYKLIVDKRAFVYHHGMQTGPRVHGGDSISGGWNSYDYINKVDTELIRKHGFARYAYFKLHLFDEKPLDLIERVADSEGEVIRRIVNESEDVCDLGCGGNKTVENAVGVDLFPKGEMIPTIRVESKADVVADVTGKLPFEDDRFEYVIARHILEHTIDPINVIREWYRIVKPGGSLIIAVPNQEILSSIPLNIEHLHAFTPDSLGAMASAAIQRDDVVVRVYDPSNGVSFVMEIEK